MTGRKGDKRLKDMSIQEADAPWSPPPIAECDVPEHVYHFDLEAGCEGVNRMRFKDRKLVDFAVSHRSKVDARGPWLDVARVDCCHSEAHKHVFRMRGSREDRTVIRLIRAREDVDSAYDEGYLAILGGQEEHLRRWTSEA